MKDWSTPRIASESLFGFAPQSATRNASKIDSGGFVNVLGMPAGRQPNPARCRARLPSASPPMQGSLAGLRRASCASVGTRLIPCTGAPEAEGLPTHPPPGDTGWLPRLEALSGGLPGCFEVSRQALRCEQADSPEVAARMGANCIKPFDQFRSNRERCSQPILTLAVLSVHAQQTPSVMPCLTPQFEPTPLTRRGSTQR